MARQSLFHSWSGASLLTTLLAFTSLANAQTWSLCNPMNTTTCAPNPALGINNATFDFVNGTFDEKVWNATSGKTEKVKIGRDFTIYKRFDSPTIQSNFYIFWGQVSVIMKAAPGQGVVSSIVLQSDDLDEVDWELIGGNNTHVQSNYFGKGNTTSYDRAVWHPINDPQNEFHNYTNVWTKEKLEWYIDGNLIRTLKYEDALGGYNYPQTPMNVRIGIWAGGDEDNDKYTIEWSGGKTNYDDGPYTMTVQQLQVADYSVGKEYVWSDKSGSYESIKAVEGTSSTTAEITAPKGMVNKYLALSQTAKIGIACGALGGFLLIVALMTFCCIKQRRAGRAEKGIADAEFEKNAAELTAYRTHMQQGGFAMEGRRF